MATITQHLHYQKVVVPMDATFMDVKNEVLRVYRGISPSVASTNDLRYGQYTCGPPIRNDVPEVTV